MIESLRLIVHSIPTIAFFAWLGLLIFESQRAYPNIVALQKKYDPNNEFIRQGDVKLWFAANLFYVNEHDQRYTSEFKADWNRVYRAHWRRIYLGICLLPIFGFGSRVLKQIIVQSLGL
jgi:hypothetical protein